MKRILIVDDEKNVLSSFHKILTQEGCEVSTASSAEEGLSVAQNNAPDLLIMDIKMSGLDGVETFKRIKDKDSNSRIIIMTGYRTMAEELLTDLLKKQIHSILYKPFKMKDVLGIISK